MRVIKIKGSRWDLHVWDDAVKMYNPYTERYPLAWIAGTDGYIRLHTMHQGSGLKPLTFPVLNRELNKLAKRTKRRIKS